MISLGHIDFRLHENDEWFTSRNLQHSNSILTVLNECHGVVLSKSSVIIHFLVLPKNCAVVKIMLLALSYAQEKNIPLIFDRDGLDLSLIKTQLPLCFEIGLFTSGTTGKAKVVFHPPASILPNNSREGAASTWLLCYHPMSFAGLQVLLQALVCGDQLIVDVYASTAKKAQLAHTHKVNAISATPSFMRALMLCWQQKKPSLRLVTLGGEICNQVLLDALKRQFPHAKLRHIYATTESGVIFTVKDGLAGFPDKWLAVQHKGWQLRIRDDLLYLVNRHGEVATGDIIVLSEHRCFFAGRVDNVVNIGGIKVNLVEIEDFLINIEGVNDVRVFAKANPITGNLVCAEIKAKEQYIEQAKEKVKQGVKQLSVAQQPRIIKWVDTIALSAAGKKIRMAQ